MFKKEHIEEKLGLLKEFPRQPISGKEPSVDTTGLAERALCQLGLIAEIYEPRRQAAINLAILRLEHVAGSRMLEQVLKRSEDRYRESVIRKATADAMVFRGIIDSYLSWVVQEMSHEARRVPVDAVKHKLNLRMQRRYAIKLRKIIRELDATCCDESYTILNFNEAPGGTFSFGDSSGGDPNIRQIIRNVDGERVKQSIPFLTNIFSEKLREILEKAPKVSDSDYKLLESATDWVMPSPSLSDTINQLVAESMPPEFVAIEKYEKRLTEVDPYAVIKLSARISHILLSLKKTLNRPQKDSADTESKMQLLCAEWDVSEKLTDRLGYRPLSVSVRMTTDFAKDQ